MFSLNEKGVKAVVLGSKRSDTEIKDAFEGTCKYKVLAPVAQRLDNAIHRMWRQRGRVVRAPDLKSVGRGFKSRSDG